MAVDAAVDTSACPDLADLEAGRLTAVTRAHVAGCRACQLVVELVDQRSVAAAERSATAERAGADADACARFEPLLAIQDDGESLPPKVAAELAAHLATCAACRLVVGGFTPELDAGDDHLDLPEVETTAYALGAEVARGGMGRILAARDLRVGRPVAVKELLGRSPSLAARFEREARVTARLQHPGIVPIYEIGRWPDGTPFYSMRLVDGRTLREALAGAPTLAARLALLPPLIAAVEAVAFAHSKHVIHRDLTPANILVGAYGETVVIDWGLAKDRAEPEVEPVADADAEVEHASDSGGDLTAVGAVIGTATYMPPEQASGVVVDERADVYALGAILYHLLAGAAPYVGTRDAVLAAVKAGPPRPLDAAAAGAPNDLISIATKAMARDRAGRYASARELADELNRFQTGRLVEAHVYSRRDRLRRWARRNRAAVIAGSLALAGVAIAATISIARVIHERDRAEAERAAAVAASARLLEEQGRQELLAGNPMKATAWLSAAYTAGDTDDSLRALLGLALRDVELVDRTLDCGGGEVQSLELDPTGERLVAACDEVVKVWRVRDFAEEVTISAPDAQLAAARFTHDGRAIVTWGPDGTARRWDATTGALERSFAHGAPLFSLALTPDDHTLITTGFDGAARLWDATTGAAGRVIQVAAAPSGVRGLLSPDGKTLGTATGDGHVTAWDLATGAELGGFAHGSKIVGGNLSHDGARAITCGDDRTARVWDARTGAAVRTLAAHADVVTTCEFSPDDKRALTTSNDGTAVVWDLASGRVLASVAVGGLVGDGKFSPDGKRFTTARLDGWLGLWAADTGALIAAFDDKGGSLTHAFSPAGDLLFAARRDGTIRVIGLGKTWMRRAFVPPEGEEVVAASPDGAVLVTRRDRTATAWDVATGRATRQVAIDPVVTDELDALGVAHAAPVTARFDLTGGSDAVRVWDAAHRELAVFRFARLEASLGEASFGTPTATVRYAPDGAIVILSTGVAVWELPIEQRSPHAIGAIAERLPWRIEAGKAVERTAELSIAVADAPGATVTATRLPDMVEGSTVATDPEPPHPATRTTDGTYTVELPPGRYGVEVSAPGRPAVRRAVLVKPDGATVTLAP